MLQRGMDKTVRVFDSFAEMKAAEYRYWRSRPVHERMAAVSEITPRGLVTERGPAGCSPTSKNYCGPSTPTPLST